ncbi:receptor activity-modifying protein 1-like isoform X1 [Melopsittacus undulatus]|uniref:receptor activity-modifying protein 1-like isoform X1 n=1 Tax=Melopsittacus undulatus TaxID=13146 RepID=UPI00146B42AC|nr:receptor activity-modifying protein 1-like isoform X1 [Melopsittacus undulatus]
MPKQSQEPPAPVPYPQYSHPCSAQLGLGGGGGGMSEVLGASQLMLQCSPSTHCLFAAGCGDTDYGDLEDEGYYMYLDEDELPEVLGGAARCQDTYQDWISLYCWAPLHATLMTTPEGSRCCWDQISSTYSELSGCTQLLAQLLSCPWPSSVLDAFFLQVHAEYFINCTGAEPPRPSVMPPRLALAVAMGLSCLVPLAAAVVLSRAPKGAHTPAPACPHACEQPAAAPSIPSPGN